MEAGRRTNSPNPNIALFVAARLPNTPRVFTGIQQDGCARIRVRLVGFYDTLYTRIRVSHWIQVTRRPLWVNTAMRPGGGGVKGSLRYAHALTYQSCIPAFFARRNVRCDRVPLSRCQPPISPFGEHGSKLRPPPTHVSVRKQGQ
jgi:hypothetical protein